MAFSLSQGPVVGLDIGTSAVRAAQVTTGRSGSSLVSFGQVALPPGAMGDGEIRDAGAVAEAISQLWKRSKIKSKRAIIGVANQRVVVRPLDLPYLEEKEFRASLRFQVADQIPMPVETAELDFQIIDDYTTEGGDHMMRVLLVAAATDMVDSFVHAASSAGVETIGIDLTPFAIARAVSPAMRGERGAAGSEAIVDVGAGVTNIMIHQNGEARFVRILLVGGDDATGALAEALDVTFEEAEAAKLDLGGGVGSPEAQRVLGQQVDGLVDEIRGSLDYYASQEDSQTVTSVLLTGGGSLTPGLFGRLEQVLRTDVQRGAAFADLNVTKSGLTGDQVAQVEPVAAAAIGLALGAASK